MKLEAETELFLIRHGQTAWNRDHRIQGQQDVDLDDAGRAQAEALTSAMHRIQPDVVHSSDLVRALSTARIATGLPDSSIHTSPALRERCFGIYETFTQEEIRRKWDPGFFTPDRGEPDGSIEGAEEIHEFQMRCVRALESVVKDHPGQRIAVFTHGGVIRSWVCYWLEIPMTAPRRFKVTNTSIHQFLSDPVLGWVAGCLGDTRHLEKDFVPCEESA